jgi:hypothetical protein
MEKLPDAPEAEADQVPLPVLPVGTTVQTKSAGFCGAAPQSKTQPIAIVNVLQHGIPWLTMVLRRLVVVQGKPGM